MTVPNSPLTQDHLNQINAAMSAIATAESQIALAKAAGIDVSVFEQQLSDNKNKLLALKRVYFPGA